MEIKVEITKSGLPAYWEQGGGHETGGEAVIVAGEKGQPLRPIFTRNINGRQPCGRHALFAVTMGFHVIHMIVERYICTLTIMRVHNFSGGLITIYCCHNMADIEELPEEVAFLENAVDAAFQKARRYNCRAVYYAA